MACASKTVLGEGDEDGRGRGSAGGVVHAGAAAGKLGGTSGIPATGTNGGSPSGSGAPAVGGTGGRTAGPPDVAGEGGVPTRICTNGWLDAKTGLEKCEEGYLSRPAAKHCGSPAEGSGGAGGQPSLPRASGTEPCERDADCRAFELGYCRTAQEGAGGGASRFCASGCLKDDDRGRRSIYLCSPGSEHGELLGIWRSAVSIG